MRSTQECDVFYVHLCFFAGGINDLLFNIFLTVLGFAQCQMELK